MKLLKKLDKWMLRNFYKNIIKKGVSDYSCMLYGPAFKVGDKVRFKGERLSYTIQACAKNYLICTKPFSARRTVIYTIVDLEENVRGQDDRVFCSGYETRKDCEKALLELLCGDLHISSKNRVPLEFEILPRKRGKVNKF
jgi:hypothetical protein